MTSKPATVFLSYAEEDKPFKDKLEKHLTVLKRQSIIETWQNRMIAAGEDWKGKVDSFIDNADVILLLISADFLGSEYCWDVEMKRAMERHERGVSRVIPIILRQVDWREAPFAKLMALPRGGMPIADWENEDQALTDVALELRQAIAAAQLMEPSVEVTHSTCDVLVVAANPIGTGKLALEEEAAEIRRCINGAKPQREILVHAELATSVNRLRNHLHTLEPAIVHFAGHGDARGNLLFETEDGEKQEVKPEALADLFKEFPGVECVTLNACYSADAAEELAQHVHCVVGMGSRIDDGAARQFSLAFYEALARGRDFRAAYHLGCNGIDLNGLPAPEKPILLLPDITTTDAEAAMRASMIGRVSRSASNRQSPEKVVAVKLWFGTTRRLTHANDPTKGFSNLPNDEIQYGTCFANVPRHREAGSLGSWFWYRWLTRHDDRVLLDRNTIELTDRSDFWNSLQQATAELETGKKHALVFIHGFRVSFRDAARRTAQIAVDLPFPGPAAFFAWPSRGHLFGYSADEEAIRIASPALSKFLCEFRKISGAEHLHLIAHSMGNRGLLSALDVVARELGPDRPFNQIFLAAPDVSSMEFGQLSVNCGKTAEQTTLYASRRDRAIWASRWKHLVERVGYQPPIQIFDGVDTVCLKTGFDLFELGHGYVGTEDDVLADMNQAIRHGATPQDRRLRSKCLTDGSQYWELQPR